MSGGYGREGDEEGEERENGEGGTNRFLSLRFCGKTEALASEVGLRESPAHGGSLHACFRADRCESQKRAGVVRGGGLVCVRGSSEVSERGQLQIDAAMCLPSSEPRLDVRVGEAAVAPGAV